MELVEYEMIISTMIKIAIEYNPTLSLNDNYLERTVNLNIINEDLGPLDQLR